jgi:hypothetical protein
VAGLSAPAGSVLGKLRQALEGFDATSRPWTVIAKFLLDRTRIGAEIAGSDEVAVRARGVAIWQFMNFVRAQPAGPGLPILRLLDRIRRLVLLADERDLRELPAAAQSIDAVRLMTIHGSKGLEFPAVHIPGMNADTLPRSPNHVRGCVDGKPDGRDDTVTTLKFDGDGNLALAYRFARFFATMGFDVGKFRMSATATMTEADCSCTYRTFGPEIEVQTTGVIQQTWRSEKNRIYSVVAAMD